MLTGSEPDTTPVDEASAVGLRVAILSDAAPERNGVGAYYRDLADHLRADLHRFRHYADYDALDAEDETIRDGDS